MSRRIGSCLIFIIIFPSGLTPEGEALKFIIFVIDGPGNPANANEIQLIDAFNEKLQQNKNWITAAGIRGPESSTLIDNREGKGQSQPASLFNSPEYYSGFWIIEAVSEQAAKEWALEASWACNRKVELRPYIQ